MSSVKPRGEQIFLYRYHARFTDSFSYEKTYVSQDQESVVNFMSGRVRTPVYRSAGQETAQKLQVLHSFIISTHVWKGNRTFKKRSNKYEL